MAPMTPKTILTKAFLFLTDAQLRNLSWHEQNKTPVCCGATAELYADGEGGG